MTFIGWVFTFASSIFLLTLPRRFAAFPFLIAAAYMTRSQQLEVGPAHFTVLQILVTVGFSRVLLKSEQIANGMNQVDRWLILWAIWYIASCVFHTSNAWIFRIGVVWNDLGCYFLLRFFVQDGEDVERIFKVLCVVLVPLAVLMVLEKSVGKNLFAVLGAGGSEMVDFRHGHFRARGPFAHAILAGVVGATCFPMALYMWKSHLKQALMGLFASGCIIVASTSSGPIMMLLFIMLGLASWKIRALLNKLIWLSLAVFFFLDAVMKDPVYFLMAKIDISGGSTGWYRARLIQSSIEHLDEWWLAGTDYTRHWMPTGQIANQQHADFTNQFVWMGVMGGLPLMFIFIMVLVAAFGAVGSALQESADTPTEYHFLIWILGAILFGYVWNFFSITLYDQSVVFFYLILASICAVKAAKSYKNIELVGRRIRQSRYVEVKVNNT